jgi:phosphate:Na+ symporter
MNIEFKTVVLALAALVMFLYGIEHLSREIQRVAGDKIKKWLFKLSSNRFKSFFLGVFTTGLLQSSTAVSVITVSLVEAKLLSFQSSLGIIIGANVGTTVTAQLVSLKLNEFAPLLIVLGALMSLGPVRLRIVGKSIFYFGFVFFSLDLLSDTLVPLAQSQAFLDFIAQYKGPVLGVIMGVLVTALLQSSSVTTGIAVLLVQTGIFGIPTALPMVIGANAGTTITTLIAAARMQLPARRTALAHSLFNISGVLLVLPFLGLYGNFLTSSFNDPAIALAWGHTGFNFVVALIFLVIIKPYGQLVEFLVPEKNTLSS